MAAEGSTKVPAGCGVANRYAAPALAQPSCVAGGGMVAMLVEQLASLYVVATSVSPESATPPPNQSFASALGALMYNSKLHVVPDRVKMYTAPASGQLLSVAAVVELLAEQLDSYCAPTASVSPESTTGPPK